MQVVLCGDCRDFLQSHHDEKWRRFMESLECERSVSQVLEAFDAGCRLCEAITHKFRSLQVDLLSFTQASAQAVVFRLIVRPYWNTNLQWEEDIDRPFLQVSASQQQIEFRLWRVTDNRKAEDATYDDQSTGSETSFARAQEWLRRCMLKHDSCNAVNTPKNWVPSRLIDIGSRASFPDTLKLRQTKGWKTPVRYAALSHCWGAVQPVPLLESNLRTRMDGMPAADLPKTFQDAVYATRKFGIQYLWIDSLCIIQDSKADWDLESSLMTFVYGGCLLNIAAASSNDCTGGLFQNRPPSYLGSCFISVESHNDGFMSYYQLWDKDIWPAEFEFTKLNTRAWVMQERMLSPRTLAFGKTQVFWECRCKRASEKFPSEYPIELFEKRHRDSQQPHLQDKIKTHAVNHHADSRLGDDEIPRLSLAWHNLVMLYSRKDMSFEQDKLVAISGLADLFAQQMGTDYFAGLWKSTLLKDLLWEVDADGSGRSQPLNYRAPSWSWASVKSPVKYIPGWIKSNEVTVTDVEIQITTKGSQFGRVSGGHIQVEGRLFSDLNLVFGGERRCSLMRRGLNGDIVVADCTLDEAVRPVDRQPELFCLPIGSYLDTTRAIPQGAVCKGLVLVTHSNNRRGYYKRWGIFQVTQPVFFKDAHNQAPIERYVDDEKNIVVIL